MRLGKVWWRVAFRSFVGAMTVVLSLLVVGCAPELGPAVSTTLMLPATLTATPAPTPRRTSRPAPAAAPATRLVPTLTPEVGSTEVETVTFTVVYDNNSYDRTLRTAWGFACLVETGKATVLFDTGGDGSILLGNMARLDVDLPGIDAVVLSHIHGDHIDGLAGLLDAGVRPVVYVPATFPASFKTSVRARTDLVEVEEPLEILPGIYTTGEVGSDIVEQALAVETGDGLVVVTGCAHPGVVEMVRRAREVVEAEVALVMGGFHLRGAEERQIDGIIADFRRLGVQRVAPCHCTGGRARQMFAGAFGTCFTPAGVGWTIAVGPGAKTLP
jgi:7,8-dihydropterin-6-yl-methyl-4-(beta-D-ribofuranosyl)aminobenzene 5'-phosphate synthase